MKLQISTLVTIITAAMLFGGFYYTTTHRLDQVEAKITKLEKKIKKKGKK
jgi:cell division protein FtsL